MVNYQILPMANTDNYQWQTLGSVIMSKVTIAEAVKMVDVSQTTLYRDMKEGKISTDKDTRGKKVVDIAELQRVYGNVRIPENETENNGNSQEEAMSNNGNAEKETVVNNGNLPEAELVNNGKPENGKVDDTNVAVIALLEKQVEQLEEQLENAKERESKMTDQNQQLMDMLSTEQEKTKILMLPPPKAKGSFLNYFRLKR